MTWSNVNRIAAVLALTTGCSASAETASQLILERIQSISGLAIDGTFSGSVVGIDGCKISFEQRGTGILLTIASKAAPGPNQEMTVPIMESVTCSVQNYSYESLDASCSYLTSAPTDTTPDGQDYYLSIQTKTISVEGVSCTLK